MAEVLKEVNEMKEIPREEGVYILCPTCGEWVWMGDYYESGRAWVASYPRRLCLTTVVGDRIVPAFRRAVTDLDDARMGVYHRRYYDDGRTEECTSIDDGLLEDLFESSFTIVVTGDGRIFYFEGELAKELMEDLYTRTQEALQQAGAEPGKAGYFTVLGLD